MYEFICIECGEIFPYKAQVYDDHRCIYCGGQLAVKAAQQSVQPTLGEQSELKCVFCNQPLHEYETHCLVAQSG